MRSLRTVAASEKSAPAHFWFWGTAGVLDTLRGIGSVVSADTRRGRPRLARAFGYGLNDAGADRVGHAARVDGEPQDAWRAARWARG